MKKKLNKHMAHDEFFFFFDKHGIWWLVKYKEKHMTWICYFACLSLLFRLGFWWCSETGKTVFMSSTFSRWKWPSIIDEFD